MTVSMLITMPKIRTRTITFTVMILTIVIIIEQRVYLFSFSFYTNTIFQSLLNGDSALLPPMWPGFDSQTRCHMWIEFVVGSLLCSERFLSGYNGFPLYSKTNISKFQFDPGMH